MRLISSACASFWNSASLKSSADFLTFVNFIFKVSYLSLHAFNFFCLCVFLEFCIFKIICRFSNIFPFLFKFVFQKFIFFFQELSFHLHFFEHYSFPLVTFLLTCLLGLLYQRLFVLKIQSLLLLLPFLVY